MSQKNSGRMIYTLQSILAKFYLCHSKKQIKEIKKRGNAFPISVSVSVSVSLKEKNLIPFLISVSPKIMFPFLSVVSVFLYFAFPGVSQERFCSVSATLLQNNIEVSQDSKDAGFYHKECSVLFLQLYWLRINI